MKNKSLFFLILSLGIASGTQLVDRFITPIPNMIATVLIFLAGLSLVISIMLCQRKLKSVDK